MAISINWGTKVISVLQGDLTPLGGGLYRLDLDVFRLALKALEDDEEGMPHPDTHQHNTEVSVGGVTLARVIEFINGYTITFEDLQYGVEAKGANSNIADVMNVNQVSLRTFNAPGLISAGTALSTAEQTKLDELHKLQGLDISNPMTVTPTTRDAGAGISQTISGDGETTTTVTRDP